MGPGESTAHALMVSEAGTLSTNVQLPVRVTPRFDRVHVHGPAWMARLDRHATVPSVYWCQHHVDPVQRVRFSLDSVAARGCRPAFQRYPDPLDGSRPRGCGRVGME